MERAVIGAALLFAAIVAGASIFGLGMPSLAGLGGQDPVIVAAPGKLAEETYQAKEITVQDAAVRLLVTPEDREDVSVAIDNPGALPMPEITLKTGKLVLNGKLRGRTTCHDNGGASVKGYGEINADKLPLITIHTPRSADIAFNAAGSAEIGAAQQLSLSLAGCGRAKVADVAGALDLNMGGAAHLDAGAAGTLKLSSGGANHARIGAVKNGADVSMGGASETVIARVDGALNYSSGGAGELKVGAGALQSLTISSGGAGVFELGGGSVESVSISDGGAGDFTIAAPVKRLRAKLAGAGKVIISDTVGDIDVDIAGAGEVKVKALTGTLKKKMLGPGAVTVGP